MYYNDKNLNLNHSNQALYRFDQTSLNLNGSLAHDFNPLTYENVSMNFASYSKSPDLEFQDNKLQVLAQKLKYDISNQVYDNNNYFQSNYNYQHEQYNPFLSQQFHNVPIYPQQYIQPSMYNQNITTLDNIEERYALSYTSHYSYPDNGETFISQNFHESLNHVKQENVHHVEVAIKQPKSRSIIDSLSVNAIQIQTKKPETKDAQLSPLKDLFTIRSVDADLKQNYSLDENIKVELLDETLWNEFDAHGTEMIISKPGR